MAEHSDPHWMEHAVKHPGALSRKAKAAGESLSAFERQHHNSPATERQIALAKAFREARHKGN